MDATSPILDAHLPSAAPITPIEPSLIEPKPLEAIGSAPTPNPVRRALLFDPGWLFLIAGVVVIAATILLPAQDDLGEARFYRDRVLAAEQHRLARIDRYQGYLDAVNRGDAALIRSLAAVQLNKAPVGQSLLATPGDTGDVVQRSASVFAALEPPPLVLGERTVQYSTLERWTIEQRPRLWLLAGGGLCLLIGLLPGVARRGQ